MGTWGAGNFENDGALDYVGELMEQLAERIEEHFTSGSAALDESGEAEVVPSAALMIVLATQVGAAPPRPDRIVTWQTRYLAIYDEEIDQLDPDADYRRQRRKVIHDTFAALKKVADQFWQSP